MSDWAVEWFVVEEGGSRRIPAFAFLADIPHAPRVQLLAILEAVRQVGPEKWRDMDSHCPMDDVCGHLHEVRDRHDQMLYRLYLRWQRDRRCVVVIDGRSKKNSTTIPDEDYEAIAAYGHQADGDPAPVATAADMVALALELSARVQAAEERAAAAERDVDELLER